MKSFYAISKQLLGARYERVGKSVFLCLIVYYVVSVMGIKVAVAPSIFYLTMTFFSLGVMWRSLGSAQNAESMMGLFMLPFDNRRLVGAYMLAFGSYTLITKTLAVLTLFIVVGRWEVIQFVVTVLCACSGCLLAAVWRIMLTGKKILSVDAYAFYRSASAARLTAGRKRRRKGNILVYLFRYLTANKSYRMNMVGLWVVACFLPLLLGEFEGLNVMPLGFAILSLNTPVCVLLSCDRELERAVRMLPGQAVRFGGWYCFFLFVVNMATDSIYLMSWQFQNGGVVGTNILTAGLFALQSAVLSVVLEWHFPIQNWKIENDLWHHPRKYIVPGVMMLLAVLIGARPIMVWVWIPIVIAECLGFLFFEIGGNKIEKCKMLSKM
ncbi:MAG: hypothetical protein NC416_01840 [Eubacterium sp.]|nr:hypothetical protein [Eubacterium sp.]